MQRISLDVELTNRCDNSCVMCPRESLTRRVCDMDSTVFGAIIDGIENPGGERSIREVWFTGIGECLLHPEVVNHVAALKKIPGLFVGITTNGKNLDNEIVRGLSKAGLDGISVSIHGTGEVYSEMMPGSDFDDMLDRVHMLVENAGGGLNITIVAVETPINREQIRSGEFRRFWQRRGIKNIEIFPCHSRAGFLRNRALVSLPVRKPENCAIFLPVQFISCKGEFLACCSDLTGETSIGNVVESGLAELIDRKIRIGNPREYFDLCKKCPDSHDPADYNLT
ncbi:MAG TPA: radical SAM protein [bacterium]|nr:radical SAM protein [bacterium]